MILPILPFWEGYLPPFAVILYTFFIYPYVRRMLDVSYSFLITEKMLFFHSIKDDNEFHDFMGIAIRSSFVF